MTSGGIRSHMPLAPRATRGRRTSASSVCRRWLLRGVLSGLLVALCLVGYEWVPSAVAGLMTVQHVSITGATRLDRRDILALLDLPGASSLLWLDRAQLARQVEAHPWVASASVGRALPHTLSVVVVERQPAAWVRHANRLPLRPPWSNPGAGLVARGARGMHSRRELSGNAGGCQEHAERVTQRYA